DELAADEDAFASAPPDVARLSPEQRKQALSIILDTLRRGLAITADALDPTMLEVIATGARQSLRHPWSIGQQEQPRIAAALIVDAPKRDEAGLRGEALIVRGGPRSRLAKQLNRSEIWGERLSQQRYTDALQFLIEAAERYQLIRKVLTTFDVDGWRLAANA